jgi:acyl carrier protein
VFLGEMYGVNIDDDNLDGFETVEDVVGYVEDYLNGKE